MEHNADEIAGMENQNASILEYVTPSCPITFGEKRELSTPDSKIVLIDEDIIGQATNNEFLKSSKISPDGSQVLTTSETDYLTTWRIPAELIRNHSYYTNSKVPADDVDNQSVSNLLLKSVIPAGESIYDYCWYPGMTAEIPSTCCVLVSTRDHPLQVNCSFLLL